MKKATCLYKNEQHEWYVIARDPEKPDYLIDTNEYIIIYEEKAIVLDPGGIEIFPAVFSAIAEAMDPRQIEHIFSSHQDPDIISSLSLWLEFNPKLTCYVSGLWSGFIPHFGGDKSSIISIPDEGTDISLGALKLNAFPAHYLHSSGNFHLWDEKAKILFSGDVGAALLPPSQTELYVKDFDKHIRFAEGFHKRWMGSNEAKRDWCERASKLDLEMMCPQHGAIYTGEDITRFIHWFDELRVGSGIP